MQPVKSGHGAAAGAGQKRRTVLVKKKKEFEFEALQLTQFAEVWAPNFYIEQREGQVLSRGMLLKYDIFPSSKIVRTDISISGGPNYRKIAEQLPLCAVGQPSIHGIRTILNMLIGSPQYNKLEKQLDHATEVDSSDHSESDLLKELHNLQDALILMPQQSGVHPAETPRKQQGKDRCIWINLREEPVVYLNNRPFVLRDIDHPFRNMQQFKGITWRHLREVEGRLKTDILIEAARHHNILIHKENANKEVLPCWEGVTHQTVQTSEEAFTKLIAEGYDVQYYRVPITPESDLLDTTIDSLFQICIKHSLKQQGVPYFLVNCQMGRGRSTVVTICIYLIFKKLGLTKHAHKALPTSSMMIPPTSPLDTHAVPFPSKGVSPPSFKRALSRASMPHSQSNPHLSRMHSMKSTRRANKASDAKQINEEESNEHGDYEVINRILRVLEHGKDSKKDVDEAIEACGHLYNLKHEMKRSRLKLENAENDDEKELTQYSTIALLSKYCTLICFAEFLRSIQSEALLGKQYDFEKNSYSAWMHSIPSLQKIKIDITALKFDELINKYHKRPTGTINAMLISHRQGTVLSAGSILKADIAPKTRQRSFSRLKVNEQLDAVRFRFLQDVGIATCATPPSIAIESILKKKLKLQCQTGIDEDAEMQFDENANIQEQLKTNLDAIWIDLREEPVLYIRTSPYVVRHVNRPHQRLPEFDILTERQLSSICERLKKDIQTEAAENDNKLLVHYETRMHELKESLMPIDMTNPNEIQTTKQIFDALREKGYRVSYQKLPFRPATAFEYEQLEKLGQIITEGLKRECTIIFSCRQGNHRSTVAAVLAILIAYHQGTLTYVNEDDNSVDEAFKSRFNLKAKLAQQESAGSLLDYDFEDDDGGNVDEEMKISPRKLKSEPDAADGKKSEMGSPLKMPLVAPASADETNVDEDPLRLTPSKQSSRSVLQEAIERDTDEDDDEYPCDCSAVLALIRILRKGLVMKRQVDNAIEHCSQFYHIREAIYESRAKWENARTAEETEAYLQEAMRHLRIYTHLICFNAYLYELYHAKKYNETVQKKYKLLSFTEWMQSRGELKLWSSKMMQNPKLSLSMNEMDFDQEQEQKGFAQVFEQRGKQSSVLSGNAMLKVDYFPGCAQLSTHPEAESAINFRYIEAIGVAGLAIPTIEAMQEVVLLCGQQWKSKSGNVSSAKSPIHWICLREEPVLYVNNEPVVLREVHQPYENLIFTGITAKRVEAMEKTLKEDATKECTKFENKLLIHAESDTGNLEAEWEEVSSEKIQTCREAYSSSFKAAEQQNQDIACSYYRLPITDEQAPPPSIVDKFVRLFESSPSDSVFIFNCQMGRGRTTTGMIVYALWKHKCNLCRIPSVQSTPRKSRSAAEESSEEKSKEALINGEYNSVLALLRILPKGKEAKKWCDDVIDVLSHMQNLRKAIYQMKLRSDKTVSDKSRKMLAHRTQNYLQRYCLLIAFASYLLSDYKMPDANAKEDANVKSSGFNEWLAERGAVKNCVYSASLDDD